MAERNCRVCGRPFYPRTGQHVYCTPVCREQAKISSRPGGRARYGSAHQKLREAWKSRVASGSAVCARCSLPIAPNEHWDLDHDDRDPTRYIGVSHRACNRATASRGENPLTGTGVTGSTVQKRVSRADWDDYPDHDERTLLGPPNEEGYQCRVSRHWVPWKPWHEGWDE